MATRQDKSLQLGNGFLQLDGSAADFAGADETDLWQFDDVPVHVPDGNDEQVELEAVQEPLQQDVEFDIEAGPAELEFVPEPAREQVENLVTFANGDEHEIEADQYVYPAEQNYQEEVDDVYQANVQYIHEEGHVDPVQHKEPAEPVAEPEDAEAQHDGTANLHENINRKEHGQSDQEPELPGSEEQESDNNRDESAERIVRLEDQLRRVGIHLKSMIESNADLNDQISQLHEENAQLAARLSFAEQQLQSKGARADHHDATSRRAVEEYKGQIEQLRLALNESTVEASNARHECERLRAHLAESAATTERDEEHVQLSMQALKSRIVDLEREKDEWQTVAENEIATRKDLEESFIQMQDRVRAIEKEMDVQRLEKEDAEKSLFDLQAVLETFRLCKVFYRGSS